MERRKCTSLTVSPRSLAKSPEFLGNAFGGVGGRTGGLEQIQCAATRARSSQDVNLDYWFCGGRWLAASVARSMRFGVPSSGERRCSSAGRPRQFNMRARARSKQSCRGNPIHRWSQQVRVQSDDHFSNPVAIDLAAAQPAVQQPDGQLAYAIDYPANGSPFMVSATAPASATDVLVIFPTGLGDTDKAIADGALSPP